MNTKGLELAASRAVLGLLRTDDLTLVGVEALEEGCDSPSLRILAGLNAGEAEEARGLFDRVLSDFNIPMPSKRDAVMRLARDIAKGILEGTTSAYKGAQQIWNLTLQTSEDDFPELDPFVYAASEWEDRSEAHVAFEEGILVAARDLVSS